MNKQDVVVNFRNRKVNRRTKTVSWSAGNVWCEGDVLYSYGRHFPLAIYLGERDGSPLFVRNTDIYSNSTSSHQSVAKRQLGGCEVSNRALAALKLLKEHRQDHPISIEHLGEHLLRYQKVDYLQTEHCVFDELAGLYYHDNGGYESDGENGLHLIQPWQKPDFGWFVPYQGEIGTVKMGYWFFPWDESLLHFRYGGHFYVATAKYVYRVEREFPSAAEAYKSIVPETVRDKNAKVLEDCWFVPLGWDDRTFRYNLGLKTTELKNKTQIRYVNLESTTVYGRVVEYDGNLYSKGRMRSRFNSSCLTLGNEWHLTVPLKTPRTSPYPTPSPVL